MLGLRCAVLLVGVMALAQSSGVQISSCDRCKTANTLEAARSYDACVEWVARCQAEFKDTDKCDQLESILRSTECSDLPVCGKRIFLFGTKMGHQWFYFGHYGLRKGQILLCDHFWQHTNFQAWHVHTSICPPIFASQRMDVLNDQMIRILCFDNFLLSKRGVQKFRRKFIWVFLKSYKIYQ